MSATEHEMAILPSVSEAPLSALPVGVASVPFTGNGTRPCVLFIEASAERRARIRQILDAGGLDVDEAIDTTQGVERLAAHAPDLVLLDEDVSDFDNGASVRRLRRVLPAVYIPLVVHGTAEERADCVRAGCDGFLDEPLESDQLPQLLRAYLAGRREALGTERLEREVARLTGENGRLRDQLRVRNDFLHNLSHDLATPLTPLVGYLRLLRSGRLGALAEKQQHVADAMVHATERLGRSIDNLVDYASLESGDYRIHVTEVDLSALVDTVANSFHGRARDKHLRVDLQKPEHLFVSADERRIKQALGNVLDNALKTSPHGGHVLLVVSTRGDRVEVAVFDQGTGLPSELTRRHEVEPLTQDLATSGTAGLGLPVTRQIAAAHGGGLILESPPRDQPEMRDVFPGSRVGFWIPRQRATS